MRRRRDDVDLVDVQEQLERRREAFANVDLGDGVTRGGRPTSLAAAAVDAIGKIAKRRRR